MCVRLQAVTDCVHVPCEQLICVCVCVCVWVRGYFKGVMNMLAYRKTNMICVCLYIIFEPLDFWCSLLISDTLSL